MPKRRTPRTIEQIESDEQLEKELKNAPTTTIGKMFSQLNNYPLLTREQEAKALSENDENLLVMSHQRLVISIAKKYSHLGVDLADLIQEGNLGLLRAIRKFDQSRNMRLSTYAYVSINNACKRYVSGHSRMIKIPEYYVATKLYEYHEDNDETED